MPFPKRRLDKNIHNLGAIYTKICPWGEHEFKTANKGQSYCSFTHKKNAEKARQRERKYEGREVVTSKPGASYRLGLFKEESKVAAMPVLAPGQRTEIAYAGKAPLTAIDGYQLNPDWYNLVAPSDSYCAHGVDGYCVECDFT